MQEVIPYIQLILSFVVVPAFGYIIKLEKRITRLEVKIEVLCNKLKTGGGEEK